LDCGPVPRGLLLNWIAGVEADDSASVASCGLRRSEEQAEQ
jgi:hypothetical protein